jgi:twitching motility protein PilT
MKLGMQTMEQSLGNLIVSGVITLEEGLSKSAKPDELQRLVAGAVPTAVPAKAKTR